MLDHSRFALIAAVPASQGARCFSWGSAMLQKGKVVGRQEGAVYLAGHILVLIIAEAVGLVEVVHGTVIGIHEFVLQGFGVCQVPPPSALL